jgi:hypothetical protein
MAEAPAVVERTVEERIDDLVDGGILDEHPEEAPPEQAQQDEQPQPEAKDPEAPAEYEFELKGAKFKLPPELKEVTDHYSKHEDATRKWQEAADLRKNAELAMQQAKNFQALQGALQPQLEELAFINKQLKAYQKVDWNVLTQNDPLEAQKHFIAYQQIKEQKAEAEAAVRAEVDKHSKGITETRARMQEESAKTLEHRIKNWNSEKLTALHSFAKSAYGFTDPEIAEIVDPRRIEEMHDAMQWRALQASKPQINQKVAQASKTLKPQASANQNVEVELKQKIRSARGDAEKAKLIDRLIQSRL